MLPTRIAAVRYLNTAPLIEGLEKLPAIELIPSVPSRIVDLLNSNAADIGLASIIDAAASPTPLALIPVGMIGCDGPTLTVRLFSSLPFSHITQLHADSDSHTSTILAQVLLAKLHNVRPDITRFHARERVEVAGSPPAEFLTLEDSWPPAIVLIGDKVVTDAPPAAKYPFQMDLGEAWHTLTGLPFVYAMWMCRAEDADSPNIALAAEVLDRQRRHNATRLDWIVQTRAPQARWPVDTASHYIGRLLRYHVGPRERQAVEHFLSLAAELGLVPRRNVQWSGAATGSEHDVTPSLFASKA